MAASVVYEGVGGGGTLFEGTKFWIALRVPSRQRYIDLVQANGGTLVTVEKDADILIADHAKPKLAPAGSISWKFIEESCKNGKLESLDDHPAGAPKGAVRSVGSSAPARGYRIPFTPEDDRILMKWVSVAEREGKTLKGMVLYEDLERINPRHTSQSWRDRWVKILQFRPRPELDDNQEEEGERDTELSQPKAAAPTARLPAKNLGPAPKVTPGGVASGRRKPPLIHVNKPHAVRSTKLHFTEKDLERLDGAYDDILNIDESLFDAAWKEWAKEYPQHTAKEWSQYWTDHAMPQLTKQRALATSELTEEANLFVSEDSPRSAREESSRREQTKSSLNRSRNVPAESTPPLHHPSKPRNKSSSGGGSAARIDSEPTVRSNVVNNRIVRTSASPRSTGSGNNYVPVNKTLPRSSTRSESTSVELRTLHDKDAATEYRPAIRDMVNKSFEEDLRLFIAKQNAQSPLPFEPFEMTQMISGRPIELARLWEVVTSPENGGFEKVTNRKKWPAIASQLNFNVFKYPEVWHELSDIYERYLADFEDAIVGFWKIVNEYGTIDDQSLEGIAATATNSGPNAPGGDDAHSSSPESEHDFDDDLDLPSPSVAFQSRSKLGSERHYRPSVPHSRRSIHKRRRIDEGRDRDQNIEIPSTPEEIQDSVDVDGQESSPEDLTQRNPVGRRLFHARHTVTDLTTTEPETQDFYFAKPVDEASGLFDSFETAQQTSTKDDAMAEIASKDDDSTQSQTDSQRKKSEDFQKFVDFHVGLGYEEDTVHEALEATTLTTENASLVMEHLQAGQGIPANMEGVWTTDDDRIAREGENGSEFKKIIHKHGQKRFEERMKFLDMLASAESES